MRRITILLLALGLVGCEPLDQNSGYYGSDTVYSGYGVNSAPGYYGPGYSGPGYYGPGYYGSAVGPEPFYQPVPGPYPGRPFYGRHDHDREWRDRGRPDRRDFHREEQRPTVLAPPRAPRSPVAPPPRGQFTTPGFRPNPPSRPQPPSLPQPRSQPNNLGFGPPR